MFHFQHTILGTTCWDARFSTKQTYDTGNGNLGNNENEDRSATKKSCNLWKGECMCGAQRSTDWVRWRCGWLQGRIDGDDEGEKVEEVDIRQGTYVVRQVMLSWSDVDN